MANKINLVINAETEEVKTYLQPAFIKGSVIREGIKIGKQLDNEDDINEDIIDQLALFVSSKLYNNQFTADELIDGIDARKLIEELMSQLTTVFGEISGQGKNL